MKRIVYLTPWYFDSKSCIGGGERYPMNCARGVVEGARGQCVVEVVSYDDTPRTQVIEPGVTLRLLPAVNRSRRFNVLSWAIPGAIAGADLVHIHQAAMRASEVALLLAKRQGIPTCVTDHGSIGTALGVFPDRLDLADLIISNSDYGASLLTTSTPVKVIKGGIDARFFAPPPGPRIRDRVLFVGRLAPHKGIDRLIRAMPPELPLTVCGRPWDPSYFRLLRRLARGRRVEFILDADDERVRDLYRRAWVSILPSVFEEYTGHIAYAPELMGMALLEAMACGTPVICSAAGAMPEFVREDETGFIIRDQDELTSRIRYLAGNPAAVEQLGRRARQVALEEYDLGVVGAKLWATYEDVLTRHEAVKAAG